MRSTISHALLNLVSDDFAKDKAFLEKARKDVGQRLLRAAKRIKKDGDEHKINLSAREKTLLEGYRVEFKKSMDKANEAAVDAYFPFLPLYSLRVTELERNEVNAVLTVEGSELVLVDMRTEIAKMDMVKPMKRGEDAEERARSVVKNVLTRHNLSDDTDPEVLIAIDMYSRINPDSGAASSLIAEAIDSAQQLLREAKERESFMLLEFACTEFTNREKANASQAAEARRREAFDPAIRNQGFFERLGAAAFRGFNGASTEHEVPMRGVGKKKSTTGFREIVREAEEASKVAHAKT